MVLRFESGHFDGSPDSFQETPVGLPVGWANHAAPAGWQEPRKREGRRAGTQKDAGPIVAGPALMLPLN